MLNDAGPDRRRVHRRPCRPRPTSSTCSGRCRRGPSLALVPPPPAGRRVASGSRSWASALTGLSIAGPHARDVLAVVTGRGPLDARRSAFMDFRRVDLGMIPALVGRINYAGDLGYELWVAPEYQRAAVRPGRGRRRAAWAPAVRVPGADVAAAREELRDVVPRVPPDLHAARGRDHALHQARPRVHRPGGARGRAGGRRPGAAARGVRRRARSGRSGRRHRRRADLARRRRSSAG